MRSPIPSVENSGLVHRTIAVLRAVASSPDGVGLSDVARLTGIPKATCHRILGGLENEHLVALHDETKRYHMALGVMSLVAGMLEGDRYQVMIHREIVELAQALEETAGLDILGQKGVVVIMQAQGPRLISQAPKPVPRTLPEWCTSTGKVLNAWRPEDEVRERMHGVLSDEQLADYLKDLVITREQGYGVASDELEKGAAAVAVPVRVGDEVTAAVWIGGPSYRITRPEMPSIAERLHASAGRIEKLVSATGGWLAAGTES